MEMNIVEALFVKQPHYIVLISGLLPELETVTADVAKDLGFTYLCFNHIKSDYNPVNKRVEQLMEKKVQGIILCGNSFPSDKLGFKVNYHIHLSLNKTLLGEVVKGVSYEEYTESIKDNFINKYLNIKPGYEVEKVGDDIFDNIIAHIDSIVHKKYKD